MNHFSHITENSTPFVVPCDIRRQIELHPYDPKRLKPIFDIIDAWVRQYDPLPTILPKASLPFAGTTCKESYGLYLADHHEWTSSELKDFLLHLNYTNDVAEKVEQAFKRHDAGKIAQHGLWKITEGKQKLTPEQKEERILHVLKSQEVFNAALLKSGLKLSDDEIQGLQIARYLALFHHERNDGRGPFGKVDGQMCEILRAAVIIDTFHGKLKAGKDEDDILDEMQSEKHAGQFDEELLKKYKLFNKSRRARPAPEYAPSQP